MASKEKDPLVPVIATVPDAVLEIRYAFDGNAFGKALYPFPAAYLRRSTARKLKKAADELREEGWRLVIFDAYRPLSVQKIMWKQKPDRSFVADPARGGSNHNRGAAVDVSLADGNGRRAKMPSEFDAFGPEAAHGAPASEKARKNLAALRKAMEAAGFRPLHEEWWHYDDPAAASEPVLDVSFENLENSFKQD